MAPPNRNHPKTFPHSNFSLTSVPMKIKTNRGFTKEDRLFDKYANKSLGVIDPSGIESLCSDLRVPHTDGRILMLAWKMESKKQGFFSKDEWRRGLKSLGADTLPKLKKVVTGLDVEVLKSGRYMDFYNFAFRYSLTENNQRNLDLDTASQLLTVVLGPQYPVQVQLFIDYLKIQSDYRVINSDQWTGFYHFFNEVNFSKLERYDPFYSWPLILDTFVEWLKERENKGN